MLGANLLVGLGAREGDRRISSAMGCRRRRREKRTVAFRHWIAVRGGWGASRGHGEANKRFGVVRGGLWRRIDGGQRSPELGMEDGGGVPAMRLSRAFYMPEKERMSTRESLDNDFNCGKAKSATTSASLRRPARCR